MNTLEFISLFRKYVVNWPLYSLNKFRTTTYKLRGGGKISIRPEDRCSFNDVFIFRHYDAPLPWKNIQKVVDIGANVGSFTVFAGTKNPHAAITAFEPDPQNYQMLQSNAPASTHCLQAAISGQEGEGTLYKATTAGGHSLHGEGESIPIKTLTLATYLPCDLLKMDCEGAEYDIFRSLSDAQLRLIHFMLIELHTIPGESREVLCDRIKKAGFAITVRNKHVILCERM